VVSGHKLKSSQTQIFVWFSTLFFPFYKMLFMNRLDFSCFADVQEFYLWFLAETEWCSYRCVLLGWPNLDCFNPVIFSIGRASSFSYKIEYSELTQAFACGPLTLLTSAMKPVLKNRLIKSAVTTGVEKKWLQVHELVVHWVVKEGKRV
jgi:hypothetical protein